MKKLYLLKTFLLLCALVGGNASGWATPTTYSFSNIPTTGWKPTLGGSQTINTISWTYSVATYLGSTATQIQVGSKNNPQTTAWTIQTPISSFGENKVVTAVSITAKTTNTSATYDISVGGSSVKSGSLTTTSSTYSVSNLSVTDGSVAVTMTGSSGSAAMYLYDISVTYDDAPSVAKPTFSVEEGSVTYGTTVTLTAPEKCIVYYTTDGSDPRTSETANDSGENNTVGVIVNQDLTIKAVSFDGDDFSSVASATYTLIHPDAPTISEPAGPVEAGTSVTITAATGCSLYYTTDGSAPNGASAIEEEDGEATMTVNSGMTIRAISVDDHLLESEETTATYTIAVFSAPTFSIADMTMTIGEQKAPEVTTNSEGAITYTSANTSVATIVDGKINAVAKGTVTITANLAKDATNLLSAASTTFDVTVNLAPVWDSTSKGIDVLTYTSLGLSTAGTGYTGFSNKSVSSSAIYAGKAASNSGKSLQLNNNSTNYYGIVTTTSGGKVRKITVSWYSNDNNKYLDVYAKNTAYSSGEDLYSSSSSTQGELIGSVNKQSSEETINVTGDYQYIGIRARNGAVYPASITIYWEGDAVSLSDASDYTPTAKDYAKVTLNRDFNAGWNGVVLPFDLTTDVKTALGASEVKTLGSATEEDGSVTLNFTDASLPVAAGTPVLVKLGAALESGDVVINGAEIKTTDLTTIVKEVEGDDFISDFTLTGTYTNKKITDEAYFVAGDKFYHKAENVSLDAKPFRAYITQETVSGARKAVTFNLDGAEASGIADINRETKGVGTYYDMQGRRVAKPTKGLYIVNGKKTLVKSF